MTQTQAEQFVESSRWQFAKTMPQNPHEYTVRGWHPDQERFEAFVLYVREHGYVEKFGRWAYTYLQIGEWKYWTMGAPVGETVVVNRAKA